MKVELLSFPGCPNAAPAREALLGALTDAGLPPTFDEVDVTAPATPDHLRGWPSPTILVDGADLDRLPAADRGGCRLYGGRGYPTREQIAERLRARGIAAAPPSSDAPRILGGGALLAALAASACCLGPAILAVVGLSGAGLSAAMAPWRPALLAVTAVLVAAGLYLAFRPQPRADACACLAPSARRAGRWMMVIVALIAAGIAAYPAMLATRARAAGTALDARATAIAHLRVEGITCPSCAHAIVRRLSIVAGVAAAEIDTDRDLATVRFDPARTSRDALAAVVSAMPEYEATVTH